MRSDITHEPHIFLLDEDLVEAVLSRPLGACAMFHVLGLLKAIRIGDGEHVVGRNREWLLPVAIQHVSSAENGCFWRYYTDCYRYHLGSHAFQSAEEPLDTHFTYCAPPERSFTTHSAFFRPGSIVDSSRTDSLCWAAVQEAPGGGAEVTGAVATGQGDNGDGGGLSWLTQAAGDPAPSATAALTGTSSAAEADSGNDWLTIAQSSGKKKTISTPSATAAKGAVGGSAAPGGWMSSGKLGVPTGDDSDDDDAGKGAATTAKSKKKNRAKGAVSAASGPGGWLNSGALGVPTEDDSDEDGGDGSIQPMLVTIETQTEDDIDAITERGSAPALPPWAKRWTPKPQPEDVPDAAPEPASQKEVSWVRGRSHPLDIISRYQRCSAIPVRMHFCDFRVLSHWDHSWDLKVKIVFLIVQLALLGLGLMLVLMLGLGTIPSIRSSLTIYE